MGNNADRLETIQKEKEADQLQRAKAHCFLNSLSNE